MFQPSVNLSASNIQSSMRIPKLQLPSFDGYILKWPEFLGYLQIICAQTRYSECNFKFSYLKGSLCDSAALAITGISVMMSQ